MHLRLGSLVFVSAISLSAIARADDPNCPWSVCLYSGHNYSDIGFEFVLDPASELYSSASNAKASGNMAGYVPPGTPIACPNGNPPLGHSTAECPGNFMVHVDYRNIDYQSFPTPSTT